jgi:hypothetical protein
VWVKHLVFPARPGHGKGACQLCGCAGELRSAAGSQHDQAVLASVEMSSIGGASPLRPQWMQWCLTRVSGEPTMTGGELGLCWLWIDFEFYESGGRGKSKMRERRSGDERQLSREMKTMAAPRPTQPKTTLYREGSHARPPTHDSVALSSPALVRGMQAQVQVQVQAAVGVHDKIPMSQCPALAHHLCLDAPAHTT